MHTVNENITKENHYQWQFITKILYYKHYKNTYMILTTTALLFQQQTVLVYRSK